MPLINCPDCGKEVSGKAKTCPNCGRPINKDNFVAGAIFYIALIGFGVFFLMLPISFAPIAGGIIIMVGGFFFVAHLILKLITEIK
jgi:hypothetical protein